MSETQDFSQLQQRHVMQSWSTQEDYKPIPVQSTEGCWIHTTDGRKIFDLRSAHECINIGFRHPKVLQTMREKMEKVVYLTDDFSTEPTAKLAQKFHPDLSINVFGLLKVERQLLKVPLKAQGSTNTTR